ncbi:MAG: lytic transglycosylase domain-containing protein [Rickettsiales bacterium]|jgi:soluble lytic murein transglycosylase|nr:lytic transglycosylase domain-containing protein [Rickettsiales bacterium]
MIKIIFFLIICIISNNILADENLFFNTNKDIKIKLEVTKDDINTYNNTIKMLNKKEYAEAVAWADSIESEHLKEAMINYTLWKKYESIDINEYEDNFANLLHFIQMHQYLPELDKLKEKAEDMYLKYDIPYQYVDAYFKQIKPLKVKTILKLSSNGYGENISNIFNDYNLSGQNLSDFIETNKASLKNKDYIEKIENLILNKKYSDAEIVMKRLGNAEKKLYSAIININRTPKNFKKHYSAIPFYLKDNELLLYTEFNYYHKNKNSEKSSNIILSIPKDSKYPNKWWTYQKYYSREFFKQKDYKKAYFLATNQNLTKRTLDYAEAEWLAGWLALEFLGKEKVALKHFENLYNNVSYPASKSRGAYWIGRSYEKMKDFMEAIKWYDVASKFSLYFYGQLALYAKNSILEIPSLINNNPLPKPPIFTKEEEETVINDEITSLAYLIKNTDGDRKIYTDLFRAAINKAKTDGEKAAIFEIVKNTKDEQLIMNIAKFLSYKNIYFIDNLFPVLLMINTDNPNSHLVHAIIRQESGFHISATSRVGATGFMQVMPATARQVAKQIKLKYNEKALRTNPVYNIIIGSYYINSLMKQFDGSQVLAIASYNAGPNAVKRWVERYGDPRIMTDIKDIINWIESIEYSETRDYVQKIFENSIVYEYILYENNKYKK